MDVAAGRRVLVVQDEETSVQTVTRALEPHGFRAVGCTQAHGVVEQVKNLGSHVVILDLTMRNGNAYDALRLLKADGTTADIPVVTLGPEHETQHVKSLGAVALVAKRSPNGEPVVTPLQPVG